MKEPFPRKLDNDMLRHEFWADYHPQKFFKELHKEADTLAKLQENCMLNILEKQKDPDMFDVTKQNPTPRTLEMFSLRVVTINCGPGKI